MALLISHVAPSSVPFTSIARGACRSAPAGCARRVLSNRLRTWPTALGLVVWLSRHDPQEDDAYAVFLVSFFLGGEDLETRLFDEAPACGAVKGTEIHRNTQPVGLDPARIIASAQRRDEQPTRTQPGIDRAQERRHVLPRHMGQRVEGGDGIEALWRKFQLGHISANEGSLRDALL